MASSAPERCQCGTKCIPGGNKTRKSKFPFLRVQKSLDSSPSSGANSGVGVGRSTYGGFNLVKDDVATCQQRRPPPARRARSAERYEGLRVNDRSEGVNRHVNHVARGSPQYHCAMTNLANTATTAHQTSPQTSIMNNISATGERPPNYGNSAIPPMSSPPPSYYDAIRQTHLPPSYDEYLLQELHQLQINPSKNSNLSSSTAAPDLSPGSSGVTCSCHTCQIGLAVRDGRRNDPVDDGVRASMHAQRQLRVTLPPETSQDQCPCSKCQSRYSTYSYDSSNDVLLSMDTATAIQGVLTDGVACSIM